MEKETKVAKTTKKQTKTTVPKIDPKTGTIKKTPKKQTKDTKKDQKAKTTKKAETTKAKKTTKALPKNKTPKVKKEESVVLEPIELKPQEDLPKEIVKEEVITETIQEDFAKDQATEEQTPKKRGKKPSDAPLPKKSSRELTIEPPARVVVPKPKKEEKKKEKEEVIIVRPTPKKTKTLTKEEKVLYKKLEEAFNYVANLTNVVEERTMDKKLIPDLTVSELHVIEVVDENNNKPMTVIAKKLKVTVGSLIICINRLVQKGYLLRTRHEMDHRIILISVTQKGKKVLKQHDLFHDNILGLALEGITLQQAVKVMTQFAMVLENYYDPKPIGALTKKEKK